MFQNMICIDNYYMIQKKTQYKTVLYGAGVWGKRAYPYLKDIAYICDRQAETIKEINGTPVITPMELFSHKENYLIVICVKSKNTRKEILSDLQKLTTKSLLFDFFHNDAFDLYIEKELASNIQKRKLKKINIVCNDKGWILNKFALKLHEELEKREYTCTIKDAVDPNADINHHVIYSSCNPIIPFNETFMITHIDSYNKVERVKFQLKKAMMGICMSRETMEKLAAYGIPREKLCYINPAQDGIIKPKKYVLGITHRCHDHIDHRKRTNALIDICKAVLPEYFSFKIMGPGWKKIVEEIRNMGFGVEYYEKFDYEEYIKLMPSLDYYLFWGYDEGSMGYLDALRAGIGTIVTPQGYHLDIKDGITYACRTIPEFIDVLQNLQNERKKRAESVEELTWKNFTDKHIEVWNYLLGNEEDIYKNQHMYEDGIFSVLRFDA